MDECELDGEDGTVELFMVPAPASAPAAASRPTSKENAILPTTKQQNTITSKRRQDSRDTTTKTAFPEPAAAADNKPLRLCIRRGKHVRQISTDLAPLSPRPRMTAASDSQLGILSVGLGKELAEELGMLPGTVYTPATRTERR